MSESKRHARTQLDLTLGVLEEDKRVARTCSVPRDCGGCAAPFQTGTLILLGYPAVIGGCCDSACADTIPPEHMADGGYRW